METAIVTIDQFISANRITIESTHVDSNPNMPDADMDHWKSVLARPGKRMTVHFSKGYGLGGAEPTAAEVLDCLAADSAGVENAQNYFDWCSEYGYDEDSRKAERIYKACAHAATRLRNFLGDDLYDQALWKLERQ